VSAGDRRVAVALATSIALALTWTSAHAHGFGQRFDLPVPLWLWLAGAALTVVLSFAMIIDFLPARLERIDHPRVEVMRRPTSRWGTLPFSLARGASVALFVFTILAGLIGNPDPAHNLAPTMVWVGFWVGLAFVSALVGDVWAVLSPLRVSFQWFEAAYARVTGRPLVPVLAYPRALGHWPAVGLMVLFAWTEHLAEGAAVPRNVGLALLAYAAFTFAGMLVFGRESWLRHGEVFAVFFALFARFAPLELRSSENGRRLWARAPAVGLLADRDVPFPLIVFVLLVLAGVTFDGFIETPLWHDVFDGVLASGVGGLGRGPLMALALLLFPLLFLGAFWASCHAMSAIAGRASPRAPSTGLCASRFVLTLVPIAIAYHFAHYLTLLLTTGQALIPLASDPFGWGWNLFGTAGYAPDLALLDVRTVWSLLVWAIVIGHVLAVYLAHVVALDVMATRTSAILSQIPLLVLMVVYTMASLWIVAQPIVD
jgi:hypothetical protein